MRRLLFFLIFLTALGAGSFVTGAGHLRDVYQSICDLTEEHFFREGPALKEWVAQCRTRASKLPMFSTPDVLLGDLQDLMGLMQISHFQIYSPTEERRVWKGEGIDTGIRARYVEDHLVVYRVVKGGAGDLAGVEVGDEIITMEGTDQVTPWGASRRSGRFVLSRQGQEVAVTVASKDVTQDMSPHMSELNKQTALLEIPSFRSEFFAENDWKKVAEGLRPYAHVVVDIRENSGGNFVAMLRALSTFYCGGHKIGRLVQPRKDKPVKEEIDDNTEDSYQISELDQFGVIGLKTFSGYGCYRGRVTVLISSETSSTAEIFAESFINSRRGRVWGQPSAGDVVLAIWYMLPSLGEGYSVSIPEATYISAAGHDLEGHGVWPQRELQYDLEQSLAGKDTWLLQALK